MRDKRRRPNSLDIAHLAGVSQSTVSRALRADPMVSACTRERVLEVARQLNYHVDKNASNLRRRHSGTLALLFFEDPTADDSAINPFFHSMLGSIIRACSQQGYDLLVSFQDLLRDWHADYEDSHKADGIILLGYGDYVVHHSRLQPLIERARTSSAGARCLPIGPALSIGCDNVFGGRLAAEHLLRLGRRQDRVFGRGRALLAGDVGAIPRISRRAGDAGVAADPRLQVGAISTEASGYEAMQALLERRSSVRCGVRRQRPDRHRRHDRAGLSRPTGAGGRRGGGLRRHSDGRVHWTRPDYRGAGHQAGRQPAGPDLDSPDRGDPVECVTLPPRLIVRGSCGVPSAGTWDRTKSTCQ